MESLRKQLREIRGTSPRNVPILNILADIPDISHDDRLSAARIEVLKWARKRAGMLPKAAWELEAFDLDNAGNTATAVRHKEGDTDYWTLRLNDMDKSVPGQVWSTEVTVVCAKLQGVLGIRQHLQTRHDDVQVVPGVPGVVRQIADSMGGLAARSCSRSGRAPY